MIHETYRKACLRRLTVRRSCDYSASPKMFHALPCNINKGKFAASYCYANIRSPVYFREKISFPGQLWKTFWQDSANIHRRKVAVIAKVCFSFSRSVINILLSFFLWLVPTGNVSLFRKKKLSNQVCLSGERKMTFWSGKRGRHQLSRFCFTPRLINSSLLVPFSDDD